MAGLPQPLDCGPCCGKSAHVVVARNMLQHLNIFGDRRAREALLGWRLAKRRRERAERGEIERTVAPLQHLHGIERVALQRLRELRLERRTAAGGAEGSVAHRAARAPGDLAELGRIELAKLVTIELA